MMKILLFFLSFVVLITIQQNSFIFKHVRGSKKVNTPIPEWTQGNQPAARTNFGFWKISTTESLLFAGVAVPCGSGTYNYAELYEDMWSMDNSGWFTQLGGGCNEGLMVENTAPNTYGNNNIGAKAGFGVVMINTLESCIFGGEGFGDTWDSPYTGYLQDVWCYRRSDNSYRHVKGSFLKNAPAVIGTPGVYDDANIFEGLVDFGIWKVSDEEVLIFGGVGVGWNFKSDLWSYNITYEQFAISRLSISSNPIYGDSYSDANTPGLLAKFTSWMVNSDTEILIFGGENYYKFYCDLWSFDIASKRFKHLKGPKLPGQLPVFGTTNVYDAEVSPGGMGFHGGWKISDYEIIIFGGLNRVDGKYIRMNNLWSYNIKNQTFKFVKGGKEPNQLAFYGETYRFHPSNIPGAIYAFKGIHTTNSEVLIFGGYGNANESERGYLNDLWLLSGETIACDGASLCTLPEQNMNCISIEGDDLCECKEGYSGFSCEICHANTFCNSKADSCFSNNGQLNCSCDVFYSGLACEVCDKDQFCNGKVDSCSNSDGDIYCHCSEYYSGSELLCDVCDQDEFCNSKGNCSFSLISGENVCECFPGYSGDYCVICDKDVFCNDQGINCMNTGGNNLCSCEVNFDGDSCETCDDVEFCNDKGTCTNTEDVISCACQKGYTGNSCETKDSSTELIIGVVGGGLGVVIILMIILIIVIVVVFVVLKKRKKDVKEDYKEMDVKDVKIEQDKDEKEVKAKEVPTEKKE